MAVCFNKMDHCITALKVQKKNPNRVSVYLDEGYAFGVSRIVGAWLQIGQILSDEKIAVLQQQDGPEWASVVAHINRVGQRNVGLPVISFHEQVIGIHCNMLFALPAEGSRSMDGVTDAEKARMAQAIARIKNGTGYMSIQSTRPP